MCSQGPASERLPPPTLGVVTDAPALEEVLFLRDDMAAMAWAVEHQLQGDLDVAVNAYQMYLQKIAANPLSGPPQATTTGPRVYYEMETPVPDNWIPMVAVQTPAGARYLRRGAMESPVAAEPIQPRAQILEPGAPYFVQDCAVPRSGTVVDRYFRYTRSADGTIFLWLARKSGVGTGSGWCGLRFDLVRDFGPPPAQ